MRGQRMKSRFALVAVVGALLAIAAGSSASAAVPRSFYGVSSQTPLTTPDFDRMGQGNVGTLRIILDWSGVVPSSAADDYNWAAIDALVADAARNGISVLPFMYGTPQWVARDLDGRNCTAKCGLFAPSSRGGIDAWAAFLRDAVARYGPNGAFWSANPGLPQVPITAWQIWNEQNSKSFYRPRPSAKKYVKLLKASNAAIKGFDPSADVILGGMAELAGSRKATPGARYLQQLYKRKGAKKHFDGVAVHPYGAKLKAVQEQVELFRKAMKRGRDRGADLWITELGWGSARGGNPLNRGPKGQATRLKQAFKYFKKRRGKLNVRGVTWFSWMDSEAKICAWCPKSGLFTTQLAPKRSWRAFIKFTGGS
ncbi:MAG: glycosyl hydrolase [Solirubrobacterales bacterium]